PHQAIRLRGAPRAAPRPAAPRADRAPAGHSRRRPADRCRHARRHACRGGDRAHGAGVRRPRVPRPPPRAGRLALGAPRRDLVGLRGLAEHHRRLRRLPAQEARTRAHPHGPRLGLRAGALVRLPIRARLTVWYIAVLTAIIAVLGPFVVLQFRADMRATIDRDVRHTWRPLARQYAAGGLQDFAAYSDTVLPRDGADQVFDSGGRLLATWGDEVEHSLIASPEVRADAIAGHTRVVTVKLGEEGESFRAVVGPIDRLGQRQVLAVAEPFQPVEESVQRVLTL